MKSPAMLHDRIRTAVLAERERAERLFRQLAECSQDRHGITRDTYGAGENSAHDLLREYAARAGFSSIEILPLEHDMFRFYRLVV